MSKFRQQFSEAWSWFLGMLYGMFLYDAERMFRRERADLEHLFG